MDRRQTDKIKQQTVEQHEKIRTVHTTYKTFTISLEQQESAAYATVIARQSRHLANTFEVAAI